MFYIILKIIFIYYINKIIKIKKNFCKKIFYKKIFLQKRGKYLNKIGNCISCHTINGGPPYSGGLSLKTNFGIINTPNITKNKKSGIGYWNFKNFYNALKTGISKNKSFLYPIFPYLNFKNLNKKDIKSLYYYIKNIKTKKTKNKINNLKFPFKYRKLLILWRIFFFKKYKKKKNISSIYKRGEYLVKNLAHCNMCHTNINILGYNLEKLEFLGNYINKENWFSPNINKKIKNNNKNIELINILKYGYNKNKTIFGPMSEVINNSLQYISFIDIKSITYFLKKFFNKKKFFIKNCKLIIKNKNLYKKFFIKGKKIYKKYCSSCHGKIGLGEKNIYPNFKNNFINNIKNIIFYNYKSSSFKKNFYYNMPFFTNLKKKKFFFY